MKRLVWLLALVPVAGSLAALHAPAVAVFIASALAIVPLSAVLGRSTEVLADRTGPVIGALVNATLGNVAELIVAALALRAGLLALARASIVGSILGNLLLVLGAAQLAGGLRFREQRFNRHIAAMNGALLVIAAAGLIVPTLLAAAVPPLRAPAHVLVASRAIAIALLAGYVLSLGYSMGTHRASFVTPRVQAGERDGRTAHPPAGSLARPIALLLAAAVAIGGMSELLVHSVERATVSLGISEVFIGVIIVPIIANAAEHSSAVLAAWDDRMDLAVGIAMGSSVQMALLVGPVLVLLGALWRRPFDLAFGVLDAASIALAVWIATVVLADAETNWLEGALLLLLYAVLAVAFFFS